jgi:hypothetical protein
MLKTLSLLSLVSALAIGGWMWTRQSLQTTDRAPAAILQAAATALEFSHRTNGTYAGATPEAVTLVSADIQSYCIEYSGQFLAGPGGVPVLGNCPRR